MNGVALYLLLGLASGEYVLHMFEDGICGASAGEKDFELDACFEGTDHVIFKFGNVTGDVGYLTLYEDTCGGPVLGANLDCHIDGSECCVLNVTHDGATETISYKVEPDDHDHDGDHDDHDDDHDDHGAGSYIFHRFVDSSCTQEAAEIAFEPDDSCFEGVAHLAMTFSNIASDVGYLTVYEETCDGEVLGDTLDCHIDESECCAVSVLHDGHEDMFYYKIGLAPPSPPPPSAGGDDDNTPCFGRTSTACRLADGSTTAVEAYAACFEGMRNAAVAERVPMAGLRSGDLVLSEVGQISRVVVNQHVAARSASQMVAIDYGTGSLELTPDHVIKVDGVFVAAREVVVGSNLGEFEVKAVARRVAGVINPVTVAGTILAAGEQGKPVVASVYPEWVAEHMLASLAPLPFSLSNLLSFLFPAATQAFYDTHVEQLFPAAGGSYRSYLEAVPAAFSPLASLGADLLVSAAFLLFSAGPLLALATAVSMVTTRKA